MRDRLIFLTRRKLLLTWFISKLYFKLFQWLIQFLLSHLKKVQKKNYCWCSFIYILWKYPPIWLSLAQPSWQYIMKVNEVLDLNIRTSKTWFHAVPCIFYIKHKPKLYSLFAYQIASVMAKCHDCFSYPPKFVCFCFIVHNAKPRNPIFVFQTSTWWNCSLFIFFKYFFLISEVSPGVEPKLF